MDPRLTRLIDSFCAMGPVAVAFSGGVDSSLALWAAATALGDKAVGVTVSSEFVCAQERERADRLTAFLARQTGVRVLVRTISALADAVIDEAAERVVLLVILKLKRRINKFGELINIGATVQDHLAWTDLQTNRD